MNLFQKLAHKLQEQQRIVITNPDNFEVKWSVTSSRFRLYSVFLVILIFFGILISLIFSYLNSKFDKENDTSIERKKLEIQYRKINRLSKELKIQSAYINSVKKVILGDVTVDSFSTKLPKIQDNILTQLEEEETESETLLEQELKSDLNSTETKKNIKKILQFVSPSKGTITSKFRFTKHPYVTFEATSNEIIKACSSGIVLFSGSTKLNESTIIIKHYNGFISIYKNLTSIVKKQGSKVKKGDNIGTIGSKARKKTMPLQFELWYKEYPVNPEEYIKL